MFVILVRIYPSREWRELMNDNPILFTDRALAFQFGLAWAQSMLEAGHDCQWRIECSQ